MFGYIYLSIDFNEFIKRNIGGNMIIDRERERERDIERKKEGGGGGGVKEVQFYQI